MEQHLKKRARCQVVELGGWDTGSQWHRELYSDFAQYEQNINAELLQETQAEEQFSQSPDLNSTDSLWVDITHAVQTNNILEHEVMCNKRRVNIPG